MIHTDSKKPEHTARRAPQLYALNDPRWDAEPALAIATPHPAKPVLYEPDVSVRVVHTGRVLQILWRVRGDRGVLCVNTRLQDPVYQDSCVEAFLRPRPDRAPKDGGGYFNFEINCGGAMLVTYVVDPVRGPDKKFLDFAELTAADVAALKIETTMPPVVNPELAGPVDWSVLLTLPLSVMEKFVGPLPDLGAATPWRANFYKCGDQSSLPHWIMWSPVGEKLNFHQPAGFGHLRFA